MADRAAAACRLPLSPPIVMRGPGALDRMGEVLLPWEGHVLVLTGEHSYHAVRAPLEAALRAAGRPWDVALYGVDCCEDELIGLEARARHSQLILGVGGGKALDAAKLVAARAGRPVVTVPTSAATCAAWTPLSNVYSREGRWLHGVPLETCPGAVVIDHEVIARAPARLLASGIADAMAKWIEASASVTRQQADALTLAALETARLIFDTLDRSGEAAMRAARKGLLAPELIAAIDASIVLAGQVGAWGGARCRSVAAHAVANALTAGHAARASWHGEKVAYGILVQRALQGASDLELRERFAFFASLGLPVTLDALGARAHEVEAIAQDVAHPDSCAHLLGGVTPETVRAAISRVENFSRSLATLPRCP